MGARYDNIGGVQHKVSKRYDNINGVWRPVSKRYSNVAGVWRQGYTSAIEWTHTITQWYGYDVYDNNHTASLYSAEYRENNGGAVTYSFPTPLILAPGSTIDYNFYVSTYGDSANMWLTINDQVIMEQKNTSTFVTQGTLPYPSGITINRIWIATASRDRSSDPHIEITMQVIIKPAGAIPFLLTFLDHANQ